MAALAFAGPALAGTGAPTGYLEICKETQGGLTGTYEFSFAGRTARVTVANGSTQPVCTPGQQVPAGQVSVTEKQPPDTELCGIRTIQPGRLAWTRGATASVVIPAGGPETESTLVFCNRSAPKGSIAVCKETQGGLTGTFSFDLAGVRKSVRVSKSGDDPVCAQRIDVPAGRVNVTETGVAGTTLCGVRTLPAGRVASTSGTTAGITVVAGELTNVVFCDRPVEPGDVQICKVAGAGIAPGTSFTFAVRDTYTGAVTKVVVRAGECASAGSFGDGTVIEVTETLPGGVEVTSKTVTPADQGRPCGVARADRLCALVRAGFLAKLTFTNSTTTKKGSLEICKVAGTGIAPGTPFTFAVRDTAGGATTSVTIPAGQCAAAGQFADGAGVEVTETAVAGTEVTGRAVLPAERLAICAQPQPNRACATLAAGATTQVRFTNAVPQGQLKVCKVGGTGVPEGTAFVFNIRDTGTGATSSATVPAGQCVLAGQFADATTVEVTENVPVGTEVSAREVSPITWLQTCSVPQSNRVCARVGAGQVTHVTFTDRKPPSSVPLQLCKVAGSAGVTGTYTYTVRVLPSGAPQTVTVAAGSCVNVPALTVGSTVEVTETVPADETATLTVDPADEERACPTPAPARVCANVTSAPTRVVATNRKKFTSMTLCKVAGTAGISGSYAFSVRVLPSGTPQTVTVTAGACVTIPALPIDATVEVTETVPAGQVATLTVEPSGDERACPAPAPNRICASVGAETKIVATNRKLGTLKLCKVAGSYGLTGTYSFTVRVLPAGPSQTVSVTVGDCVVISTLAVGTTVEITEDVPADQTATLSVDPAAEERACPVPAAARICANVSITGTKVTATNKKNLSTATLKLCKIAGPGVANGTPFSFLVKLANGTSTTVVVQAGYCETVSGIPGNSLVEVTETLPPGFPFAPTIMVDPSSASRTCATSMPTRACASLAPGSTVEMRFTNRAAG